MTCREEHALIREKRLSRRRLLRTVAAGIAAPFVIRGWELGVAGQTSELRAMRYKVFDVFARRAFEGNPTGIVYYDGPLDRGLMQLIAAELPVPDTILLMRPSSPEELFSSLAFSPYEELKICGQGLIGAMFSLLDDGKLSPGIHTVGTALGKTRAFVEQAKETSLYVSLGKPTISSVSQRDWAEVLRLLKMDVHGDSPKAIVDLGRRRLVVEVPPTVLKDSHPDSPDVMAVCKALGITGLVFCAQDKERSGYARTRFFTTSLNGREDAVAGGAAAAVLAFYRDRGLLTGSSPLMVHQGGFATREGYIFAKVEEASQEILVGGSAVKVLEGQLHLTSQK
jgi:trans-2,3-dihydro-3-hydroxyanthranilate isomerase